MADQKKLSAAAQAKVDEIRKELEQEYEQKKAEVEAAAARKPWTVVAYSSLVGLIVGLIARGYLPF